MDIIRPTATTDATLTSSNVAETDYPEWDGTSTSYSADDFVMVTTSGVHKTYQAVVSISASGSNLSPEVDVLEAVPKWIETGATNRWKMFNGDGGEQTSNTGTITVRITPDSVINSVAMLDLEADSIQVVMTDPIDGIVYDATVDLVDNSSVVDWYAYYWEPIIRSADAVLTDLPSYGTAYIDITITSTAVAKCGFAILGQQKFVGNSNYGSSVGISDYSVKEVDDFGRSKILERAFVKRMSFNLSLEASKTDDIHKTLASYRATPLLWIGSDQYTSTFIYGYFKDFEIVLSYTSISECSIEIEGLI